MKKETKEQHELIRCKNCRFWNTNAVSNGWLPCREVQTDKNWYCGSAKKKEPTNSTQ